MMFRSLIIIFRLLTIIFRLPVIIFSATAIIEFSVKNDAAKFTNRWHTAKER